MTATAKQWDYAEDAEPEVTPALDEPWDPTAEWREMPTFVRSVTVRKPGQPSRTMRYRDGQPVGKVLDD